MDGFFNWFSWFVVEAIFHQDSGSVTRSKLHRPIFACFVQSKIPLSFVSSLFLWSEFLCMVFFRKFIPLFALLFWPSDCELWFTINWISEKSIVNTCKMFTLGVDFLAASLPLIPGYMVLFLYFGLALSSTMSRSFLYHVVRDRECIQSLSVKKFFGIRCKSSIVRKCSTRSLDSNKEDSTFGVVSHNSNDSTSPNSRIISFGSLLNGL